MLRQFLRSCNAYRTALSLIDSNPTLSFFLLVTAIEAVSNKVIGSDEVSKNFRSFILRYLPNSFKEDLEDEKLVHLLIKQAYDMRCAFTHGGIGISIATLSADDLKRKYVKHFIKGNEVYSPSLRWFESVVRAVLIEFLRPQPAIDGEESKLPMLAMEQQVINVKVKRPVKPGRLITTKDVDLDFQSE